MVVRVIPLLLLLFVSPACSGPDDDDVGPDDDDVLDDDDAGDDDSGDDDDDTSDDDDDDATSGGTLFEDVAAAAGITGAGGGFGVAAADVNDDGWPDLYFPTPNGSRLFLNQGDGTFVNATNAWELGGNFQGEAFGATFADYDNDGDPDLFVGTFAGPDRLYKHVDGDHYDFQANSGVDAGGETYSQSIALADVDGDGDLDLYKTGGATKMIKGPPEGPASPDRILRNDDGIFVDVSDLVPQEYREGYGFIGGWSDLDQDGDPDLYIVNDFGQIISNQLLRNDTVGDQWAFTPMGEQCGCLLRNEGMGLAIGDFDRDGWQDLYTSNGAIYNPGQDKILSAETLLQNYGDMSFVDVSIVTDAWAATPQRFSSWGVEFLDIDNDMWPDLFVPFGREEDLEPDVILMNDAGERFELVEDGGVGTLDWGNGAAVLDYDLDGCLDLAVAYFNGPGRLYRNHCVWGNHWLQLELKGTESNADAVGAVVLVTAGGITQREEVFAGSTSLSSSRWKTVHVGLADEAVADTIEVHWPAGRIDLFEDVPANAAYRLYEGDTELQQLR